MLQNQSPARMHTPSVPGIVTLLCFLLLPACGDVAGRESLKPTHDLANLLPAAEVLSELTAITFTSREEQRYLRSGWSRFERDEQLDRNFSWGQGEVSSVDFHLLAPRALDLRLEGRPFTVPDAPTQIVTVSVNGSSVGAVELQPELTSYTLPVPEEHLLAGGNRLELSYRWNRSPRLVSGANDRRSLAVAWYAIDFGVGEVTSANSARSALGVTPRLFVPAGSEVVYYLAVKPHSLLQLDGWAWRRTAGGASERLEVELQAEGASPVPIAELRGTGKRSTFHLPGETARIVRLALRAFGSQDSPPGSGIELRAPSVWSPLEEAPDRSSGAPPAESPGEPSARPPAELNADATSDFASNPAAALDANRSHSGPRPNIVLYLIDTLRADRLGCYGYPRPVSPRIDAFAQDAVLFEQVVANSSWTRASMASVFTGLWPLVHGANGRDDVLRADLEVLPDRLRAAGYETAAFVTNPNVNSTFGFDRGFDEFKYLGEEAGSDTVNEEVVDWLEARSSQDPFFLWVHTLDPHAPYVAPDAFNRRLAPGVDPGLGRRSLEVLNDLQAGRRHFDNEILSELEALYEASIAYNDDSFGALLDELDARALLHDTLVILLSDHGEEFHDHENWQHGRALHAESIGVPLIIKLPGSSNSRRVSERVQQVDLLPTILDALSLPGSSAAEGRSLLPLIAGQTNDSPTSESAPSAFSYLHLDGPARASVVDDGWKLIQRIEHGQLIRPRLYHVAQDPKETAELSGQFPIRTGYLASMIRLKLAGARGESRPAAIDEQTRKALEALGYL